MRDAVKLAVESEEIFIDYICIILLQIRSHGQIKDAKLSVRPVSRISPPIMTLHEPLSFPVLLSSAHPVSRSFPSHGHSSPL